MQLVADGVPIFDSTVELVRQLQAADIGTAVFSSSRNCAESSMPQVFQNSSRFGSTELSQRNSNLQASRVQQFCTRPPSGWEYVLPGASSSKMQWPG
jgi:hypothetical protein